MPINYSEFREVVERAKERGLIAHPKRKKRGALKEQTRKWTGSKRDNLSNPPRGKHHSAIFKIACPACGAPRGEVCKLTIGLAKEDVPAHASRIYAGRTKRKARAIYGPRSLNM